MSKRPADEDWKDEEEFLEVECPHCNKVSSIPISMLFENDDGEPRVEDDINSFDYTE